MLSLRNRVPALDDQKFNLGCRDLTGDGDVGVELTTNILQQNILISIKLIDLFITS